MVEWKVFVPLEKSNTNCTTLLATDDETGMYAGLNLDQYAFYTPTIFWALVKAQVEGMTFDLNSPNQVDNSEDHED